MDYRIDSSLAKGLDGWKLVSAAIDPLMDTFCHADSQSDKGAILTEATEGQRLMLAVEWCQAEVGNGGFHQFFWNSWGFLWPDALEGFLRFRAAAHAELLGKALAVFPGGNAPLDRAERCRVLDAFPDGYLQSIFRPLETAFFRLQDQDETALARFQVAFIRAHPTEFFREAS